MKHNFTRITFALACLFFAIVTKAQITVTIAETYVNNQLISNISPIAFGTNQTLNIKMVVDITAQSNQDPSKPGTLDIFRASSTAVTPVSATGSPINSVAINGTFATRTFTFTLNAADFNATQGIVFAEFISYSGLKYKSANKNVTKTVTPPITNNLISGNQTVYYGQSATLSGNTPSGGNGTFSYVWNKKTGSGDWAVISGATGQNYSPTQLTTTTQFRRIANSGTASSLASNVLTVTVNNSLPLANNVIAANQTINEGNTAAVLTGTLPTGGSGMNTYAYIWQKKEEASDWTTISGATVQNYSPGTPFVTTSYRRIVKSGNAADIISNEVIITVIPGPSIENNTISINGPLVTGSLPTGGTGQYIYKWTVYFEDDTIDLIVLPDATQSIIIPSSIFNLVGTGIRVYVVRAVMSGSHISRSNSVEILPSTDVQNNTINVNGSVIEGSLPTGGTGQYIYKWTVYFEDDTIDLIVLPDATQSLVIPSNIYNLAGAGIGAVYVVRTVTSGSHISGSNSVQILPITDIQNNSISANEFQFIGTTPTGGNGSFTYRWWVEWPAGSNPYKYSSVGWDTKDLVLTQGNVDYILSQPNPVLYRVVTSADRTSQSNSLNIYFGRQASSLGKKTSEVIKIYPNPTSKTVNFETGFIQNTDVEIIAYNEFGINTVVFKGNVNPGQVIQWDIPSNYPKGLYFYKILSGNEEIKTGKILYQ